MEVTSMSGNKSCFVHLTDEQIVGIVLGTISKNEE